MDFDKLDGIDRIICDYVTGRLEAKIKARRIALEYPDREDNLGIHTQSKGVAPQEALYLRIEGDKKLNEMIKQKKILDSFWQGNDDYFMRLKRICYLKFSKEMYWYQIDMELGSRDRKSKEDYQYFKDSIWSATF